ncbi:hypothetical protein, partial [Methanobrevibacter sp.]|uniref:hypothetical protein n=1 Tax=Methanobrevibacter sp. TaxID=66852 RepID=UPI0026DFC947
NGRDDLSNYQEQLEKFMLSKGYEIEHRDLAAVTRKKHQTTRDWSKKMQKAEEMVDLMDQKTLRDTAIQGVVDARETERLTERLQALTEANIELKQQTQDAVNGRNHWHNKYLNLKTGMESRAKDKSIVNTFETIGYNIRKESQKQQQQTNEKMLDNKDVER